MQTQLLVEQECVGCRSAIPALMISLVRPVAMVFDVYLAGNDGSARRFSRTV